MKYENADSFQKFKIKLLISCFDIGARQHSAINGFVYSQGVTDGRTDKGMRTARGIYILSAEGLYFMG